MTPSFSPASLNDKLRQKNLPCWGNWERKKNDAGLIFATVGRVAGKNKKREKPGRNPGRGEISLKWCQQFDAI